MIFTHSKLQGNKQLNNERTEKTKQRLVLIRVILGTTKPWPDRDTADRASGCPIPSELVAPKQEPRLPSCSRLPKGVMATRTLRGFLLFNFLEAVLFIFSEVQSVVFEY